jgi:ankyrin repeat protein
VNALLEAGAKPNMQAKLTEITQRSHADHPTGGFTALMWAARNGNEDVVKALAKGGADLNAKNGDNASATMIAIANDRLDIANMLLDLGADPNDGSLYFAVDQHDGTTDMLARDGGLLRWDHPNKTTTMDLIKRLLDMGADPNKAFQGQLHSISMCCGDNHNASAFYRAAVAADVEALKVLLPKADLKWMPSPPAAGGGGRGGNLGRSAVMVAATGGRGASFGGGPGFGRVDKPVWREPGSRVPAEAVELLLKAGADPNFQVEDDGNTALHQAVQRNDLEMIKVLAKNGANLELYNWAGQTPIAIAEDAWDTEKKRVGPPPEVLQAMNAGTPIPEVKTAKTTIILMRELLGWPAWTDADFGGPDAAATPAAGGQ